MAVRCSPNLMGGFIAKLKQRFQCELTLWHLNFLQVLLLLTWAAWPSLIRWVLPGQEVLALAPVIIFLPIAYPVASALAALAPEWEWAYEAGVGVTVFLLIYFGLVSWRQRRVRG